MNQITPEQQKRLASWADQRDGLLREIGIAETELAAKKKENVEAADSFSDLQIRISEAKGRLAELDAQEDRFRTSLTHDVAELVARKSRLESEIETKETEIIGLEKKKAILLEMVDTIVKLHDKVFDRASVVDQVIGHVVRVSQENISDINTFMDKLRKAIEEVIAKSEKNVAQTDIVLGKLPKFIFEMQKPIVRRIIERREIERVAPKE